MPESFTGIQRIEHWLPVSQQQIREHEAEGRAVARRLRAQERYHALRRDLHSLPADVFLVHSPVLDDAMERGVRADSPEWERLVEQETAAARLRSARRRERQKTVLKRYERLLKAARERREAEERARRLSERQAAVFEHLSLEPLLARLGMSRAFALHLLQPYCRCEQDNLEGGWMRCEHARDLGLEVWS